jgi:hypothetical protein
MGPAWYCDLAFRRHHTLLGHPGDLTARIWAAILNSPLRSAYGGNFTTLLAANSFTRRLFSLAMKKHDFRAGRPAVLSDCSFVV